ncbi:hypothetical protein BB560_001724 [Smittium megazygosporum]|uniref:Uncharacterized protein n=1 Tax=Smittium megazygosporum TaxID=133381 RepID=A0A2T9ZGT4_9FUNG|nr:hypothetical protein BB560_001724 [Smittium megazygosporum]
MCIDAVAFKKRQANPGSVFGGYEPLINNFNNGMFGDASSFGNFVNTMRSIMFTDKNALGDVAGSIGAGVKTSASAIASNAVDIGDLFSSTTGISNVISGAKNFQRSLNQNKAGYANLVADTATNSKSNPSNLNGVSGLVTNTYTAAASGVSDSTSIASNEATRALNNMNLAFNMYYPNTLGKLFQGNLDPSIAGKSFAASSAGDNNATSSLFRSLVEKTNDGQQFISPFTAAGVQLTDSISAYASVDRVSNVLTKYRSINPSTSNTVNVMNGVANAAISSRGAYRGAIDNSMIAYTTDTAGSGCGCGNSDSFSGFLAILATLSISQLLVPSGGCCHPNSAAVFARSLTV